MSNFETLKASISTFAKANKLVVTKLDELMAETLNYITNQEQPCVNLLDMLVATQSNRQAVLMRQYLKPVVAHKIKDDGTFGSLQKGRVLKAKAALEKAPKYSEWLNEEKAKSKAPQGDDYTRALKSLDKLCKADNKTELLAQIDRLLGHLQGKRDKCLEDGLAQVAEALNKTA